LAFPVIARRDGDLFLLSLDELDTGDLERVTAANGDGNVEKASNPVRFAVVGVKEDGSPRPVDNCGKADVVGGLAECGEGDGDGLLEEKIFLPLIEANGELEDA
jgi:hypothetical protein